MLKGFREFMMRGNVVDMAVGVVIGAAFTGVVTGFVSAFLTPLVGVVVGAAGDFGSYKADVAGVIFPYGQFLNVLIAFLMTAAVLYFCVVLPVTKATARYLPKKPKTPKRPCPECLTEIPEAARRCSACTAHVEPLRVVAPH
ncbi:large conductance mechanosensitive channel protein MscL [Streptomyces sp. BE20]|uniref:large conductance mechanosensitive channel protein MscL n=1 Tax=unclassified Streptomyces TaxID=2593676 RepID=UPI002E7891A8|nr:MULTISPECIES: large conductance mechanosensitive channel protein MscL [unclassified Streptomyces]MED7951786.1 large conductance mechanosensitive channel protein MscL [Streptomyces sp. BE303]MEE1828880.1 large conductance mechanosensitive channel protein MscL [Streptomyces sp. BE20]